MIDVLQDSPTLQSFRVAIKICRLSVVLLQICTTLIQYVVSKVCKLNWLNYIVQFQASILFPQKNDRCSLNFRYSLNFILVSFTAIIKFTF